MSFIGLGPHPLFATSITYTTLFFTPLMRKKKMLEIITEEIEIEKSDEQEAEENFLNQKPQLYK